MSNSPSPNWFDSEQPIQRFMDQGTQQRQLMAMLYVPFVLSGSFVYPSSASNSNSNNRMLVLTLLANPSLLDSIPSRPLQILGPTRQTSPPGSSITVT
jgi:hypothetical protein